MLNTDRLCMGCMNDNGGETVCPICGFDAATQNKAGSLPIKTTLMGGRFLVGKVYSENPESITYIGWDNEENAIVDIIEYFPREISHRSADNSIIIEEGYEYPYNQNLLEFSEITEKLKLISSLPSIQPVVAHIEENNTVYRVVKAVSGITLKDFLIRNGGMLKWEQARPLFIPLISTVKDLHDLGIVHRGISPETIIVGRDGKLRLTGICIKDIRLSGGDLSSELYSGYSAIEQYGFSQNAKDGPATDVYSIAATMFRVLMGICPPEATSRVTEDSLTIPAKIAETLPKYVLVALANALQILPNDRTSNMDEFRRDLVQISSPNSADGTKNAKTQMKNSSSKKYAVLASIATIVLLSLIYLLLHFTVFSKNNSNDDVSSNESVFSIASDTSSDEEDTVSIANKKYIVPNFVGKSYAEIINNTDYNTVFIFDVTDKELNSKYGRGIVCSQSIAADTQVEKETKITFVLSMGTKDTTVPNITGMTKDQAYVKLLESGFIPSTIQFIDTYDENVTPGNVIETIPAAGSSVIAESGIRVNICYRPDATSTSSDFDDSNF